MIYDVVIVGAGPAGASAAYALERQGYSIAIIDKSKFPRDKPCAGVLPPRIYSELEIPENLIERPLEGYRIFSPSGAIAESHFPKKGLIARREKFDDYLVKRLATNVVQMKATHCEKKSDFVKIKGDGEALKAKIVIGADGVNSVIRRGSKNEKLNLLRSKEMALALQYEISLPEQEIDEWIGNWFEVYYTIPFGYGWISPLKDAVKVGVGSVGDQFKSDSKKCLAEFLNRKSIQERISGGRVERMEAHFIPMIGPYNDLTADRTVLVGDAGGFVFPGTGEGVFYAIKSGRLAAEVISQALEEERYESEFLKKLYDEALKKSGLTSLREVDFVEKVLSNPKEAERYVRRLTKLDGG